MSSPIYFETYYNGRKSHATFSPYEGFFDGSVKKHQGLYKRFFKDADEIFHVTNYGKTLISLSEAAQLMHQMSLDVYGDISSLETEIPVCRKKSEVREIQRKIKIINFWKEKADGKRKHCR